MILSSNFAHLQRESVRHVATSLGPGSVTNGVRGYTFSGNPLQDRAVPPSYSGVQQIGWSPEVCACLGPVHLIADREIAAEAPTWRALRVSVDCTGSALTLIGCVTDGSLPGPDHLGYATASVTAGRTVATLDLYPARSLVSQRVHSRRPDTAAAEQVYVARGVLWVGWYSASGTSAVYSISIDEAR